MADPVMEFINSPVGWLTIAGIGAVIGMFVYEFIIRSSAEGFEATGIEEMVHDQLDETLKKHGEFSKVKVRRGLRTLGRAHVFEEVAVPGAETEDGDEEEEEPEGVPIEGRRKLLIVRPSGYIAGSIWRVLDFIGMGDMMEEIYILPSAGVTLTDAVEINEDLQLTKFGGVWVSKDVKSFAVAEEAVLTELLEDNLERDANWIKQMNWKDREQSKKLQNMEKENELKSRFFEARSDAAVGPE